MEIKKAVIVAAGKSSRLYPRTIDCPKGLLDIGDQKITQRSVKCLKDNGIKDIGLVVGYKFEMFQEFFGDRVHYIPNPFFAQCNNMGSLWFAKNFINDEPIIYLHSDILYDPEILSSSLKIHQENDHPITLVTDFKETDEEAMKVKVDDNKNLIVSNKQIPLAEAHGEWIGIAMINNTGEVLAQMENDLFHADLNHYDTYSFSQLVDRGVKIHCSPTDGRDWIEVDFEEDFKRAIELFTGH